MLWLVYNVIVAKHIKNGTFIVSFKLCLDRLHFAAYSMATSVMSTVGTYGDTKYERVTRRRFKKTSPTVDRTIS